MPALPGQTLYYQLSLYLRCAFQQFVHFGIPEQALYLVLLADAIGTVHLHAPSADINSSGGHEQIGNCHVSRSRFTRSRMAANSYLGTATSANWKTIRPACPRFLRFPASSASIPCCPFAGNRTCQPLSYCETRHALDLGWWVPFHCTHPTHLLVGASAPTYSMSKTLSILSYAITTLSLSSPWLQ